MKKFYLLALVVAFGHSRLEAQIKLPVFDPDAEGKGTQQVVYKDAKEARDYRHGTMLMITKSNDAKVRGTLVRVDKAKRTLYVRTEPGTAPMAIEEKDVKKVEKATYAIRPAGTTQDNIIKPEINRVVVYNGNASSVTYTSDTLSAGEKSYLQNLQEAENELMRLQHVTTKKTDAVEQQLSMQTERLRSAEIINKMLQRQMWNLGNLQGPWWHLQDVVTSNIGNGFGNGLGIPGNFNPLLTGYNGNGGGIGFNGVDVAGAIGKSASSSNIVSIGGDSPELVKMMLPTTQEQADLRKARETLASAQNRLVYEDGQIVAVVSKE